MTTIKLIFVLIFSFVISCKNVIGQCGYEDWVIGPKTEIPNEPEYWFTKNPKISNNKLIVQDDTSHSSYFNATISNPYILENKKFATYFVDSSGFKVEYIKDLNTQRTYFIGFGNFRSFNILKNCFIFFYRTPQNKPRISVFNFTKSDVNFYQIPAYHEIGYDDTCVFIAPYAFKYKKKKYKKGTIFSLNESGIRIVDSDYKKNISINSQSVFFSNSYQVSKSFRYSVETNCKKESYYSIRINYFGKFVDSFVAVCNGNPFVQLENDTLTFTSQNKSFRKYFKTFLLSKWEVTNWVDKFPILRFNDFNYFDSENLFLIKIKCYSFNKDGLKLIGKEYFTLNDIPLKEESTFYTVVMAFDKEKNEFIGYPKLKFVENK